MTRILLLFLLFPYTSFGQKNYQDSVFVKRMVDFDEFEMDTFVVKSQNISQVLVGTMMLPYTDKNIYLINQGITPISLELVEECDGGIDPAKSVEYPQIIHVDYSSSILTIKVVVVANCCHNFLGEAELIGKDTLNLLYTSYGGFCSCSCCFTLQYKFDLDDEVSLKHIKINGEDEKRVNTWSQYSNTDTLLLINEKNMYYNGEKVNFSNLEKHIQIQKPDLIVLKVSRELPINIISEVLSISTRLNVKVHFASDN